MSYLPAEWHKQSLIQLTWPHKDTDWAYMLDEVNDCFLKIAYEVLKRQSLLIVAPDPDSIRDSIDNYGADIQKLVTSKINTNDTWARDHAFITLLKEDATPLLLDFCFNGWGMKFAANYDNQINNELYFHHPVLKGEYVFCRNFILEGGSIESDGKGSLLTTEQCLLAKNRNEMNRQEVEDFLKETFNLKQVLWLKHGYLAGDDTDSHVDPEYVFCRNFILEGGSIESDGKGSLLTTEQCLLAKNRNEMNRQEVEDFLKETFNLKQVLWLKHGYLAGDDTDSHVDTLARFCPDDTIVYVKCTNEKDEHYKELAMMEEELKAFRTLDGRPYRLLPLPMASAVYDEEYHRLPATYANFLIMNEAVLYPTYADSVNDMRAKEVLAEAFPGREIVGIDCTALIKQHGSLHCVTMQYPEGVY